MKTITTVLFTFLFLQLCFSQDAKKCREIVKITIDGINKKSSAELEDYLASDFEIAGQKGAIAKIVLNQLFSQLDDNIQTHNALSSDINKNALTLSYAIDYDNMGQKNATFVFDEYNKLKKLELFEMEVKTMDNSDGNIHLQKSDIKKIPFFMIGNLIAVKVQLDNKERIFLFDSGSPRVILNAKYISKPKNETKKSISSSQGVGGSISGMDITHLEKLDFGGVIMEDQDVISLDISHLEEGLETDFEIYGLIGYELIKDSDLLFDYDSKELTLIKPEYFEQYKNEHLGTNQLTMIPFNLSSHIPVFSAQIDDKVYSFGIDCGAESNLMDDDLLASMYEQLENIKTDTLTGADKNLTEVTSALIKSTFIGGRKFKNMKAMFNDMSHLNNGYRLQLDGLMGYELLSQQKTLISYHRKQMILID